MSCDFIHVWAYDDDAKKDFLYNFNSYTYRNNFDDAFYALIADSFSANFTRETTN